MRGNAFNDWDAIWGIQFSEYNFKVATLNQLSRERETNFKLPCANITFQLSYKFIENHLSMEFGPMVQVNGKFAIPTDEENYLIKGNLAHDQITAYVFDVVRAEVPKLICKKLHKLFLVLH